MMPIVIGAPRDGGLECLRDITAATGAAGTLAWVAGDELTAAVDDVLAVGGTVLAADLPGALAHQLAVHGAPQFLVVAGTLPGSAAGIATVLGRAVAELPPSAVLVVGSADVLADVTAILRGRELADPLLVEDSELPSVVAELARSAAWERV
jgi:hypothetical protein